MKVQLSRQTMSTWLQKATALYLRPVYNLLKQKLLQEEVLHADETTLQVLHEPGRRPQQKSYMWLYRTGREAARQIVLYEYQETRKAEHPSRFLEGYTGYLHTDGYAGYHSLSQSITVIGCWAHARRKFDEAVNAISPGDRASSKAMRGKRYCDALFALEGIHPAPKSALGRAVAYTLQQWPWLTNYLLDGRLELSNNRAERSIKPFVMGRKNFLFANTPGGATISAIIYSLIETARKNGLEPYGYLTWLMQRAPALDLTDAALVELLMPVKGLDVGVTLRS